MTPLPPDPGAQAALDDALGRARARVSGAEAALLDRLRADVQAPLRAALAAAAEAHAAARTALDDALGHDDARPWAAVTAYRAATADALARLHAMWSESTPARAAGADFAEALDALADLGDDAPEAVVRAEPAGLLAPGLAEPLGVRWGKMGRRRRRAWADARRSLGDRLRRVVRGTPLGPHVRSQVVPVRALLDYHARVRLVSAAAPWHEAVQADAAALLERLAGATAAWAHAVLRYEATLDRAAAHAPPHLAPAPPETPPDPRPVLQAADGLDAALRAAADAPWPGLDGGAAALSAATADLDTDVQRVGSPALRPEARALPPRPLDEETGPGAPLARRGLVWSRWQQRTRGRLSITDALLATRARLVDTEDAFIAGVTREAVVPVLDATRDAADRLLALRADAERRCDGALRDGNAEGLADDLRTLLGRAVQTAEGVLAEGLGELDAAAAVAAATAHAEAATRDAANALPETVTLLPPAPDGRPRLDADGDEVPLGRIGRRLLADVLPDRLRQSADGLRQPLFRAVSDAENVTDVVRYNLEAALDELERLRQPDAAAGAPPMDSAAAVRAARELTVDGLTRSAERMRGVADPLVHAWEAFAPAAATAVERSWGTFHERLEAAAGAEGQLLDLRAQLTRFGAQAEREAEAALKWSAVQARRVFARSRRSAEQLIRMGQTAAGLAAATAAERQRTLDALAAAPTLLAGLPLVYRRLFALEPVADPLLLVGQDDVIAHVEAQHARWRGGGLASAVLLTAPAGGGLSSTIRALRRGALADAETLSLYNRVNDPATLAHLLAGVLGLKDQAAPDDGWTLEAIEECVLRDPQAGARRACVVEGLEHLVLRVPGGLGIVERALIFFSRTDGHIFWVLTMGLPGWRWVERTTPSTTGLVDALPLAELGRKDVEEVVMRRHARSGLPLRFEPPAAPSPLFAQRLRRAKTEDERQALVRAEFFDGLHRAAGGFPPLALFYWLRAIRFDAEGDRVVVRPIEALDFSFLAGFDLPRLFALKALLQHGTLTLEEHERIFRTGRDASFLLFESLSNLLLIEPASPDEADAQAIRAGVPYQIPPLVVAPVTQALRARNML